MALAELDRTVSRLAAELGGAEGRLNGIEHALLDKGAMLQRLVATQTRMNGIEHLVSQIDVPRRDAPPWYFPNATEPCIRLVLEDFVKPGQIVYDVGSFTGQLSQTMSRLVGPRGLVVAFEANRGVLEQLTANLHKSALFNVFPVHRTVYRETGKYGRSHVPPESPAGARLVIQDLASDDGLAVKTIALDDFVAATGLIPDFVKMDIEGGEADAISGFAETLRRYAIALVIEQSVGDDRAMDSLKSLGYRLFCTGQYLEVFSSAEFLPGATVRNLLAIHDSKIGDTPFAHLGSKTLIGTFDSKSLRRIENPGSGVASLFELPLSLSPGRYVLTVDLAPTGAGVIFAETVVNGQIIGKWYVDHASFVQNCRDIAFGVGPRDAVSYRIGTITDTELALNVEEIRVEQIGGMTAPIPTVF